jgi:hypothetical protein
MLVCVLAPEASCAGSRFLATSPALPQPCKSFLKEGPRRNPLLSVIPAKAGIQTLSRRTPGTRLDPVFQRGDERKEFFSLEIRFRKDFCLPQREPIMHAEYLQDSIIAVSGTVREERFVRIWAGIGWPDRDAGYLCVVGEREDGRYHVLSEFLGGLAELGRAAIEAKDRLLVENIWVDGKDAVAASYLRTLDGLCAPPGAKGDNLPSPPFAKAHNLNPPFTKGGYGGILHDEHTAIVVAVPDRITGNFRSALEKTRGVIMAGNLLIHETRCPKLVYTLRQSLDEILRSPVMKALVWVITSLEDHKGNDIPPEANPDPWYGNLQRGPA